MKYNKRTPCRECPFLRSSVKGFLGPDTVDSVIKVVLGENEYPCHMDVDRSIREDGTILHAGIPAADPDKVEQCAGAVICANKSFKLYRGKALRAHQDLVEDKKFPEVMDIWEFEKYHQNAIGLTNLQDYVKEARKYTRKDKAKVKKLLKK